MACNNACYQKSVLDAYSTTLTNVAVNAKVPFTANYILHGVSISDNIANSTIYLNKPGLYQVIFSAVAANQTDTSGIISVQLKRNDIKVPGAVSSETSESTTSYVDIGFSSIVEVDSVCPCSGTGTNQIALTFENVGIAATYANVKINVVKLA